MKKIALLLLLTGIILTTSGYAGVKYADITYNGSSSTFSTDSNWFKKLFVKDDYKVLLVVSITKKNGAAVNEVILVPPIIIDSFEKNDGNIIRETNSNLKLTNSVKISDTEQLNLKVTFINVSSEKATILTNTLGSIASAYASTAMTPPALELINSAYKAINTLIYDNTTINLTQNNFINTNNSSDSIQLYYDSNGSIVNDDSGTDASGTDASTTTLRFDLKLMSDFYVDFKHSFLNQGLYNTKALLLYDEFLKAPINTLIKKEKCETLKNELKPLFSNPAVNDLIAIAINDAEWPQDETKYHCMPVENAIKYRTNKGLESIAKCITNECQKTKATLIFLKDKANNDFLKSYTGADISKMSCANESKFSKISLWRDFHENDYVAADVKRFTVNSCLVTSSGSIPYSHTFSWFNGILQTHACTQIDNPTFECKSPNP